METPSLYTICVEKTVELLKSGQWKNSSVSNPFCYMPRRIVQYLMDFASSFVKGGSLNIIHLELLIKSRQLQLLDLSKRLIGENLHLLPMWLTEDVCKNLRTMKIDEVLPERDWKNILEFCVNLEEFVMTTGPVLDLNIFKNCGKLLILKISSQYKRWDFANFPESLRNLKIFSFFGQHETQALNRLIWVLLENCPNLVSLGNIDLSEYVKDKEYDTLQTFNLRRCEYKHWTREDETVISTIRYFTSSFPLLIELYVMVKYEGFLMHLRHLKHLSVLRVYLFRKSSNLLAEFLFLLGEIGPQLKYLSTSDEVQKIPFEAILVLCPNLETLFIDREERVLVSEENRAQYVCNHPLKRLGMKEYDEKKLNQILSYCKNLEVLSVGSADCLNDDILYKILKNNPLSRLEAVSIEDSSLSQKGLDMLLESAVSLKHVHICIECKENHSHGNKFDVCSYFETDLCRDARP